MNLSQIYSFLRNHHLFTSLPDEDLQEVARLFQSTTLASGEKLYYQDTPGQNFYLVLEGEVELSQDGERVRRAARRDHFGDQALFRDQPRAHTAAARQPSTVLAVNNIRFQALLKAYPEIKGKIQALNQGRHLAQINDFAWIGPEEDIPFIDRKHPVTLISRLILPLLFTLALAAGLFLLDIYPLITLPLVVLGFGLGGVWAWIDWGNDFYLVTSERVVWVEKVVWMHDQRKELPLKSILSANLSTNQIQRWIGYGDVVVRTYTGDLTMRNAAHPQLLLDLIQDAQQHAEERFHRLETSRINQTIRSRLGLEGETSAAPQPSQQEEVPPVEPGINTTERLTPLQQLLNLFRARYESNGVITYRKHKFVLLQQSWWLLLLLVGLTALFFARLVNALSFPSLTVLAALIGLDILLLGYLFVDWANDRFQITPKHIIDIDRKPLGRETKRSALLENVLSLDYARKNILQRLFDFGTVAINVGDIQLDFENVARPQQVQREIFQHYNTAVKQKEREEAQKRREDMVEFLAAYHEESSPAPSPGENEEHGTARSDDWE